MGIILLLNVTSDLSGEKIDGTFYEKELQKINQMRLELKKYLRETVINYMLNEKVMIIHLIIGQIRKILLYEMSYFQDHIPVVKIT